MPVTAVSACCPVQRSTTTSIQAKRVSVWESRSPRTVTVQAGESLWALAQRIAPRMDPRLVVAQIESLNHLAGPQVMVGQQLLVPVAR